MLLTSSKQTLCSGFNIPLNNLVANCQLHAIGIISLNEMSPGLYFKLIGLFININSGHAVTKPFLNIFMLKITIGLKSVEIF
jgi:hypothetical protein